MKELLKYDYDSLKSIAKQHSDDEIITDFSDKCSGKQWREHCACKLSKAFLGFKYKRRAIITLTSIHLGNIALTVFSGGACAPLAAAASAIAQVGGDSSSAAVIESFLENLLEAGEEYGEATIELLASLTNEYAANFNKSVDELDDDEQYSYEDVKQLLPYPNRL